MRCVPPFGEQHEALSLVILMGVVVVVVMEWGHEGGISGDFFFSRFVVLRLFGERYERFRW